VSTPDLPAWAAALALQPHPEGGFFAETWRTAATIPAAALPDGYRGQRAVATGIYFLLLPEQESRWHRVRSDELWLWHRGGPLTLLLGGTGDRPSEPHATIALGPRVEVGERPQALVPAGRWQAARPAGPEPVLVSCVVAPGFEFADFEMVDHG
jgi:predicted cupin superfamily sugar epimerase